MRFLPSVKNAKECHPCAVSCGMGPSPGSCTVQELGHILQARAKYRGPIRTTDSMRRVRYGSPLAFSVAFPRQCDLPRLGWQLVHLRSPGIETAPESEMGSEVLV